MRCDLMDSPLYTLEIPFGLIVGRIGNYLYDDGISSLKHKTQRISSGIYQEIFPKGMKLF